MPLTLRLYISPGTARHADGPTRDLSVGYVVSGERRRVDFISAVHPDCTSVEYATVHVITAPSHGWITAEQGVDYPAYPKDN